VSYPFKCDCGSDEFKSITPLEPYGFRRLRCARCGKDWGPDTFATGWLQAQAALAAANELVKERERERDEKDYQFCGNCKHLHKSGPYAKPPSVWFCMDRHRNAACGGGHGWRDNDPGQVYVSDHCHFTPSRWTPRP
jgi:hypothetical protein